MTADLLHVADPEPTHIRHSVDGYPLCWPMDQDGAFVGTYVDAQADCRDCLGLVAPGGECAP